jgi:VanZ family protein
MTVLIFWLSSRQYSAYFADLNGQPYRLFQTYLQYPAHLGEYAILGLLWMWPLSRQRIKRTPAAGLMVGAILVTAVLDESIQWYTPTRHFAAMDLCMDLAGGLVAMSASPWIFPTVAQRR